MTIRLDVVPVDLPLPDKITVRVSARWCCQNRPATAARHRRSATPGCPRSGRTSPPSDGFAAPGVDAERVYVDHGLTGTSRARPGLREALAACRSGDTLVVTKLDRLARSLPDARDIVEGAHRSQGAAAAERLRARPDRPGRAATVQRPRDGPRSSRLCTDRMGGGGRSAPTSPRRSRTTRRGRPGRAPGGVGSRVAGARRGAAAGRAELDDIGLLAPSHRSARIAE